LRCILNRGFPNNGECKKNEHLEASAHESSRISSRNGTRSRPYRDPLFLPGRGSRGKPHVKSHGLELSYGFAKHLSYGFAKHLSYGLTNRFSYGLADCFSLSHDNACADCRACGALPV
jgi:hypothetical protein